MISIKSPVLALAASLLGILPSFAQNVIRDPGFEEGLSGWNAPYIPADSQNRGCSFSIEEGPSRSGKRSARLESKDDGRISISPKGAPFPVKAGERFRLSLWVKPGEKFEPARGRLGFLVRIDLLKGREAAGVLTVDWKGTARVLAPSEPLDGFAAGPVGDAWTEVQAEFTVPENVDRIRPGIFLWMATGALLVDDVVLERL